MSREDIEEFEVEWQQFKKRFPKATKKQFREWVLEREKTQKEDYAEDSSRFGTENPDCIRFRKIHSLRVKYGEEIFPRDIEFWFNHLENCKSCSVWSSRNNDEGFNLNDVKPSKEEREFDEVFGESNDQGLGSCGGENKSGWQNITNQNDRDIYEKLHPLTPEEKAKRRNPLDEGIRQQQELYQEEQYSPSQSEPSQPASQPEPQPQKQESYTGQLLRQFQNARKDRNQDQG